MQNNHMSKFRAIVMIVLFIGVSFQPVFAIDIKRTDEILIEAPLEQNEKVEHVIQIIKTNNIIQHKIYLTQQQADELKNLIDDIHSKLDNFKSTEHTIQIFNDAVDTLNDLSIFPDNISINEIKQLITGENRNLDKLSFKNEMDDLLENKLCLVACNASDTFSLGPIVLLNILAAIPIAAYIAFLNILEHYNLSKFKILNLFFMIPYCLMIIPFLFLIECSYLSLTSRQPIAIGSLVTFGRCVHSLDPWYYDEYYPSNGWIFTLGLNGKKSYNGDFYGGLSKIFAIFSTLYNGITGFTGISIRKPDNSIFRLGFALRVNIGSNYMV